MEENKNCINIAYAKNLSKQNFNSIINVPIDSNVNIKTILNICGYVFDEKIECASGKAVVSGKIGLKVLYLDTDNITNTLTEHQPFSETIIDSSITSDCYICLTNVNVVNSVISKDGPLKINCDISFSPILHMNLGLNLNSVSYENMITKKSQQNANAIEKFVNTKFNYTTTFETKDQITKVLCHTSSFSPSLVSANDGYAIVEGKLYSTLVYEVSDSTDSVIKEIKDCFNIKTDVEIEGLTKNTKLDLCFLTNKNEETISTEFEDNNSVVTISNSINLKGVALKEVCFDIVEDLYSTENDIELTRTNRDFVCETNFKCVSESVFNEISLNKDEAAIDFAVSNLNICPEITNVYVKDNSMYAEGVVSSWFMYLDENKEYKQKQVEIPFVVNTKIEEEVLNYKNLTVSVADCKTRVKRGTIIEIEYELNLFCSVYKTKSAEIVNNINIGKPLDFGNYDYQIFIAKPSETLWNLCKRIKVYPDELHKYNKDLPFLFEGGEKVIIKR